MSHAPDLGTAVLKKLQEFGDHDVERPVQSVTVEQLRRIFADLLQRSKGSLRDAKWWVKRQAAPKSHAAAIEQQEGYSSVVILTSQVL